MFRVTVKGLLAHKFRLAATALAVMLGVAFMAGTLVLTDTIGKTFDDLFADVYEGTDAVARGEAAFSNPEGAGDVRGRVDASLVDTVAGVDGVATADGIIQGYARIIDKDGDPIGDPEMGAPTFGGNWNESSDLNPFRIVAGQPPRADNEIVIDKKSADDAGFRVGDTVTVLAQGPPQQLELSGIARFGDADSPGGASYVLFTTEAAQRLVAEPGKFDSVAAVADEGVSQRELAGRISEVVPSGVEVVTGDEITTESQNDIEENLTFFNTFMFIFAVVALLVGSFIIFNTFSITVAQRTRENALLRAIGASRRQVLGSVLVEALVVALVASLIGLVVGLVVAAGLKALLAGFGFDIPSGAVVITPRTIIVSLVVGMLVTVVAALSPARKAGKVAPVAAMRDVAVGSTGYGSKLRVVVGGVVLALGVVSLLGGLFGGGSSALPLVGLGVLFVFFGVSILGRTIALPLSRMIGALLPRLRGITGTLARENAMRNPKRTAATASALMIGVGLIAFISIFAASTKTSFNAAIDESFTGDFVIDSGAFGTGGLDPALVGQVDDLPEVRAASGVRVGAAEISGGPEQVIGLDPANAFDIIDVRQLQGDSADLDRNSIAVFEDVADDDNLAIGDTVVVLFKDTGRQELTVAMIYGENELAGDYLLGIDAYEANFADQYDAFVFVDKADGASPASALAAVERVADNYPGADVRDRTGFKERLTEPVDQLLGLIYVLLLLAIVIALLGIGNTLALSILERTRELGLLRSVGMSRSQLRSTIRWESVIIALQGTVLGLAIGLFFGWALVQALRDEGIDHFTIPYGTLLIVIVVAGFAGVLAAILPARRAAKLDVLRAIVTE
ncbi:MAG TPA: FtsX-like permease family protein [Acidimicrobiales bacterium]|nr:FtsX-like permease family protein [Acidimicrobiales bacterium]